VSLAAFADYVTIVSVGNGASGEWRGTGFGFDGSPDMRTYVVAIDNETLGVNGTRVRFSGVGYPDSKLRTTYPNCLVMSMNRELGHSTIHKRSGRLVLGPWSPGSLLNRLV
jgi:hypothetical protein